MLYKKNYLSTLSDELFRSPDERIPSCAVLGVELQARRGRASAADRNFFMRWASADFICMSEPAWIRNI